MAIKLTSTQTETNRVVVLVYGKSGVGKTRLIRTAPKPLIISTEKKLLSLRRDNIPLLKVATLDEIDEVLNLLEHDERFQRFETICLDSISDMAERILDSEKQRNKDKRAAYGALYDEMIIRIKRFRDLERFHIYFSAKEERLVDDTGLETITSYQPSTPGSKLGAQLPYVLDEVFRYMVGRNKDGKTVKWLSTCEEPEHAGKDSSGALDRRERPDLTAIFNKIANS